MSLDEMTKYLENPQQLNEYTLSELRALLRKYPYFQTAHILFLLNLKNIKDPRYKEFLKQSAVYITDRDKYLRLVNRLSLSNSKEPGDDSQNSAGGQSKADAAGLSFDDASGVQGDEAAPAAPKADPEKEGGGQKMGGALQSAEPGQMHPGKAAEGRKDKDFSTEYLRSRIAETLSEQKGDAGDDEKQTPELGNDFFIIDKVSQVEEKMARRLREKYEKEQEEKSSPADSSASGDQSDSFELEGDQHEKQVPQREANETPDKGKPSLEGTQARDEEASGEDTSTHDQGHGGKSQSEDSGQQPSKTKVRLNFGGEYFTDEDYQKLKDQARKRQDDLIDQFIRKAPEMESLTPSPDDENKDISQSSVEEKEDLASEKLIKVYIQQGYHQKAIEAYEKLSLKYPEKSDYFAEQIEKIKQTINQQKK
jgi:hypothetical protein